MHAAPLLNTGQARSLHPLPIFTLDSSYYAAY
jgi:hypothetical protein